MNDEQWQVITGDCLEVMRGMDAGSVDTVITDPPAGIAFMNKTWDSHKGGRRQWIEWLTEIMAEGLRVLKPGGMALVWAFPRTSHWTATAIEDAGFEIREKIYHLFGSGFPKSHQFHKSMNGHGADWDGWGTALKPAAEEWILAMKPLDGTFAANALRHGVAGLWVDGGRVGHNEPIKPMAAQGGGNKVYRQSGRYEPTTELKPSGRWPANVIHDGSDEVLAGFPVTGLSSGGRAGHTAAYQGGFKQEYYGDTKPGYGDTGSAARFFYCAKSSRAERDAGLEGMTKARQGNRPGSPDPTGKFPDHDQREKGGNNHPTVKPLALMRYLARLTKTPTGGVVLDPFAGSGSTGCAAVMEGRRFIGIEIDEGYADIARARIAKAAEQARQLTLGIEQAA